MENLIKQIAKDLTVQFYAKQLNDIVPPVGSILQEAYELDKIKKNQSNAQKDYNKPYRLQVMVFDNPIYNVWTY